MGRRLFMSLAEDEFDRFERAREDLGMTRSQYLKFLIQGQKEIRPRSIVQSKYIEAISDMDRNLKTIVMKESLSDEDRIYILEQLKELKRVLDKLSRTE